MRTRRARQCRFAPPVPSVTDWPGMPPLERWAKIMMLKPNYLRAFLKAFFGFFVLWAILTGLLPYIQGKNIRIDDLILTAAMVSSFLAVGVLIMFTPKEILWNEEKITIRMLFPGSGEYSWSQLEAYSSIGKGLVTFLIKFEGQQAFQIVPVGFTSKDWKCFLSYLNDRFPEKKTSLWFGPKPIRFRNKRKPPIGIGTPLPHHHSYGSRLRPEGLRRGMP